MNHTQAGGNENNEYCDLITIILMILLMFALLSVSPAINDVKDSQGHATVTVRNSNSNICGIVVRSNDTEVTDVFLDKDYQYHVNIEDHNTVTDIGSVSQEFWFLETAEFDESAIKKYDYRLEYQEHHTADAEINGSFSQIYPNNENIINESACYVFAEVPDGSGNRTFIATLFKLNSKDYLFLKIKVIDSSGCVSKAVYGPYHVEKPEGEIKSLEKTNELAEDASVEIEWVSFLSRVSLWVAVLGSIAALYLITQRRMSKNER